MVWGHVFHWAAILSAVYALHVKDRELRYCMVNRYYAEHWNMEPEAFIGKRAVELFG